MESSYTATLDHEELLVRRGTRSGLYTMVAVHSTARGPALGGVRMWTYSDARAAVRDVLRLSEGMTYKAAVAEMPMGGGKGVIMLRPGDALDADRRRAVLLDFGDTVEAVGGRYQTAEDVGVTTADMEIVAERTAHVTGLDESRGGSGDPSPWTALGVLEAIRVGCRHRLGSDDLAGRRVTIVGCGHVGSPLARLCAQRGARLLLADILEERQALAAELGAEWTTPDEAMRAEADVLAPCALGGVLDDDSIPALRAAVICGAANNQLAEPRHAAALAERNILWVPDFVANAGGIVNISVELEPGGYDAERARDRVLSIGTTVDRLLADAAREGTTPLQAAMTLARDRIAAAQESGHQTVSKASSTASA